MRAQRREDIGDDRLTDRRIGPPGARRPLVFGDLGGDRLELLDDPRHRSEGERSGDRLIGCAGEHDLDRDLVMTRHRLGEAELEPAMLDAVHRADIAARPIRGDADPLTVNGDVESHRAVARLAAEHPAATAILVEPLHDTVKCCAKALAAGRQHFARRVVAELDQMLAAVEAGIGKRLGKAETTVGDAMRLQFRPQPVGGETALRPAIDIHVQHGAGRFANALAHPAGRDGIGNRLGDPVKKRGPKSQRRGGELGPVAEHADGCAGAEPLRRDRADKAAEAVMAADADQFAAQAVGSGIEHQLVVDEQRDLDAPTAEIAVVGPAEHRHADQAVDPADGVETLRRRGTVDKAEAAERGRRIDRARRTRCRARARAGVRAAGPGPRPMLRGLALHTPSASGRGERRSHASWRSTERRLGLRSRPSPRRRSVLSSCTR